MAFMLPVMKKEFDIYNGGRSRRISECSNGSSCRSRKVSECRSESSSLSTSPRNDFMVGSPRSHPAQMNRLATQRGFSRASSRTSQSSLVTSPTKTSNGCSPPKPASGSQSSLNKFHNRLVDKLRKSLGRDRSVNKS